MDELKKLLGDVIFAQVAEKLGDKQLFLHEKDQKVIVDDGKLIPKYRLDEVLEKAQGQKAMLEKNEQDLKALRKAAEGNAELTQQIEGLQKGARDAKIAAEQAEVQIKKTYALKEALMNAKVEDAEARDLLALKFDVSKIDLDDKGQVKGFDEMVKPIKENKAFAGMFGERKMMGHRPANGENAAPIDELSTRLEAAKKSGDSIGVISLTRQISEAQQRALAQVP